MALKTSYKVNLKQVLGKSVPKDEGLLLKIGNEIIEKIKERTAKGIDSKGRSFKKYSDSYVKSQPFEVAGKSKGKVNMTLFGDMMELISVIDIKGNTIEIGWLDEDQIPKAENHLNGVTVPKRDFLGLPKVELEKILEDNLDLIDRIEEDDLTARDERLLEAQVEAQELLEEEFEWVLLLKQKVLIQYLIRLSL